MYLYISIILHRSRAECTYKNAYCTICPKCGSPRCHSYSTPLVGPRQATPTSTWRYCEKSTVDRQHLEPLTTNRTLCTPTILRVPVQLYIQSDHATLDLFLVCDICYSYLHFCKYRGAIIIVIFYTFDRSEVLESTAHQWIAPLCLHHTCK
jgi:hypothetical protein